jgi:hypothetical protein
VKKITRTPLFPLLVAIIAACLTLAVVPSDRLLSTLLAKSPPPTPTIVSPLPIPSLSPPGPPGPKPVLTPTPVAEPAAVETPTVVLMPETGYTKPTTPP